MKTFIHNEKTYTVKPVTLALENEWLKTAINEDGSFNRNCIRDISRDPEAVNSFMRKMLAGDHEGVDWYNDADAEIFGEVFSDFFQRWSARTIKALDTLSTGSEQIPSLQSPEAEESPVGTA